MVAIKKAPYVPVDPLDRRGEESEGESEGDPTYFYIPEDDSED